MTNIFIVAAKRTPFGAFGGSLKKLSATELGYHATQAAIDSANIDPNTIDAVYFGNVIQSSSDSAYLARHVGLKCGVPISAPALTINRLCGSGFEVSIFLFCYQCVSLLLFALTLCLDSHPGSKIYQTQ